MRTRNIVSGTASTEPNSVEHSGKTAPAGRKFKPLTLPQILRRNSKSNTSITAPDVPNTSSVITAPLEELLTFEQNLERNRLSAAGQQLIEREERLYGQISEEVVQSTTEREEEKEQLTRDHKALLSQIDLAVKSSLSPDEDSLEALKSAVKAILQEEEQDRQWLKQEGKRPDWRPSECRRHHNTVLQSLVEERMDNAELPPEESNKLRSSLQRDVCGKGRRLQEDLLRVVKDVKGCYPEDMDICNFFGKMYHQAFSAGMRKIEEYGLGMDDCSYLLYWVNVAYPEILQNPELTKAEVQTLINKVLMVEEQAWMEGSVPELRDNCYFSPLAIDVIQFINAAVKSIEAVWGDTSKVQIIVCLLKDFLNSYKKFQEKVLKGSNNGNSRTVIMAILACVEQFRDYIVNKADIFPVDVKECCLSIVAEMKNIGYTSLTSPIHKDLKSQYSDLGTPVWLEKKKEVFDKLFEGINKHTQDLKGLTDSCHQELLSQLHLEVTVEYVRRLLKRKIKLRDKEMQEQAARLLCEDGQRLHKLFTEAGSREEWLSDILPKIAEVLKLQDISSIQLEIVTLSQAYPDLSEFQVSALLSLKSNLSASAVKRVKKTLLDNQDTTSSQDAPSFFSKTDNINMRRTASS
ncbi:tumor necrosis factor alpha-induced protein 2 [Salmo salar]|uniref:Tumor necrosis factor alpha-induced protein 2 n=1 Tax=Salmo salar TaxID=8030 RepID=B5X3A8_SALSA|nr:tumor necrosis factor alpha-induced protein 2 [Salmo salar]ACI33789.1 Tumor necrosis factor, alpha-induced protein 2 [Salmo salar]|eukprot:NP_001133726.1 tumor necrosis factor alpha-induced protein 2 [Salmo salar]